MKGRHRVRCLETRQWSAPPPLCQGKSGDFALQQLPQWSEISFEVHNLIRGVDIPALGNFSKLPCKFRFRASLSSYKEQDWMFWASLLFPVWFVSINNNKKNIGWRSQCPFVLSSAHWKVLIYFLPNISSLLVWDFSQTAQYKSGVKVGFVLPPLKKSIQAQKVWEKGKKLDNRWV